MLLLHCHSKKFALTLKLKSIYNNINKNKEIIVPVISTILRSDNDKAFFICKNSLVKEVSKIPESSTL